MDETAANTIMFDDPFHREHIEEFSREFGLPTHETYQYSCEEVADHARSLARRILFASDREPASPPALLAARLTRGGVNPHIDG